MAGEGPPPPLTLEGISKSFGAVAALRDVRLTLRAGEAHALVGENGAGKSTLVKVLAGVHGPDTGTIRLDGRPVAFGGPADALAAGIAVIYQEPTLFPDLSVAENIFVGRQPLRGLRRIHRAEMRRRCEALFARLGVPLDPDRPARGLSIADQQLVEIAKALSYDARVLIMDEPTAALSGVEVERLFTVARSLRDAGAAVLFISHRFDEVFALCQRVTVMRDGRWVSTDPTAELSVDTLVRRMVGRDVSALFPKQDAAVRDILLDVRGLTRRGVFSDVGFTVRGGEIVALAGLVGAGRSEVMRAVFGLDRYDAGEVYVDGRRLPPGRPAAAIAAGLALVPEDRRQQGLVMELSVERNVTLTRRWALSRLGVLRHAVERGSAVEWTRRLQVKAGRLTDAVSTLSGGNQQKVVLAKWLSTTPRVLIVDEPTRGIDVATKAGVHRLMSQLAADGVAVVMVSSELPEVLGMADRVLVMHEGRLVADIARADADERAVMYAATGAGGRPVTATKVPAAPAVRPAGRLGGRLLLGRELGIVLALVLLLTVTAVRNPGFLSAQSISDLLLGATILIVLAVGQTLVVVTRNVDLSVGSIVGLVAFATGKLFVASPGAPVVLALVAGVALGAFCGAVNGGLVAAAKVPALVITLGTLYVFRGVDFAWAAGEQINAADMPAGLLRLGSQTVSGVPVLALVALVVLVAAGVYLRSFRSGRDLYAIGSQPTAARLCGIGVGRRVFGVFVANGALAGLAGVLYAARFGTVDATAGTGLELQVVAAVVVGGVAIFGGSGTVWGAALGALLLTTIGSSLAVLRIDPFWQQAVVGALILAAIGIDRALAVRVAARLRGRNARGA